MYDNQIFNVNGDSDELLLQTLELAFAQSEYNCVGWTQSIKNGLQLEWTPDTQTNVFPTPLTARECFPIVLNWLNGEFAARVECVGMDADIDQDGHNSKNWRVYRDDADGYSTHHVICRVKPAYTWYGK